MDTNCIPSTEGWTWIVGARKWHFFRNGERTSICGNWALFSLKPKENDNHDSPDNCAVCKRLRAASQR